MRSAGTAQAACWNVKQLGKDWAGQKLFVVVTRTVPAWAKGKIAQERYAFVAVVEDPQATSLYAQIRQALQVQARVRVNG